jgi:hypothetical protein
MWILRLTLFARELSVPGVFFLFQTLLGILAIQRGLEFVVRPRKRISEERLAGKLSPAHSRVSRYLSS